MVIALLRAAQGPLSKSVIILSCIVNVWETGPSFRRTTKKSAARVLKLQHQRISRRAAMPHTLYTIIVATFSFDYSVRT